MFARALTLTASLLLPLSLGGCPSHSSADSQQGNTQPSPNASILPAPLAASVETPRPIADAGRGGLLADDAGRLIIPEAGPPEPTMLREDMSLPRDTLTAKDGVGVTLDAVWKWPDAPAPFASPETSADGIKKAREKTALRSTIDLAPAGRMRFTFASASFPVPFGAELRSSSERYGHVVVWPDGSGYRILPPGTLRAFFAERRADVVPLTRVKPIKRGKGSYLGLETTKVELKTAFGTLLLEQAAVPNIGRSGELFCRLLVDLVAVDPSTTACSDSMTPLRATLGSDKGKVEIEVGTLTRRQELPFGLLFMPPAGAEPRPGQLPPPSAGVLMTQDDLAAFRTKAVPGTTRVADAPAEGIVAVNTTDTLRYLLLDGVPVAWIAPRSEQLLIGSLAGRYSVSWRDLLGNALEAPEVVTVPARAVVGAAPDGGAPKP